MKEQGRVLLADVICRRGQSFVFPSGIEAGYEDEVGRKVEQMVEAVRICPIITADNVWQYYVENAQGKDAGGWSFSRDVPNAVPPFPLCFLEAKVCSGDSWRLHGDGLTRCGIMLHTLATPSLEQNPFTGLIGSFVQTALDNMGDVSQKAIDAGALAKHASHQSKTFHITLCTPIAEFRGDLLLFPSMVWTCNEIGQPISPPTAPVMVASAPAYKEFLFPIQVHIMMPLALAIAFMHCKNVRIPRHEPVEKLSKAQARRHGYPLLRYHTLEIDPMRRVLETEGDIQHNGLKKALHIVRGHFATLTRNNKGEILERPTTYFRDAHTRGSLAEGAVIKDYLVKGAAS